MMEPRIELLKEKKVTGKRLTMTFAENKTIELWRSFMPRRKEIMNAIGSDLISMQVYGPTFDFKNFNPLLPFDKWATTEVSDFDTVPEGMETFIIPTGTYAVFHFKGDISKAPAFFGYIFGTWLPASEFELDNRPHFEVLGEKYKRDDPNSEEDVWIPVKVKG